MFRHRLGPKKIPDGLAVVIRMSAVLFIILTSCGMMEAMPHLAEGEEHLREQRWQAAGEAFNKAIDTGELFDAALSMAYWNAFSAYDNMGNDDEAAEALLGFLVSTDDFLDKFERLKKRKHDYAIPMLKWIQTFNVHTRIDYGKAALEAMWAARSPLTCRSLDFACNISDVELLDIFRQRVFCKGQGVVSFYSEHVKNKVMKTKVTCADNKETYYFDVR